MEEKNMKTEMKIMNEETTVVDMETLKVSFTQKEGRLVPTMTREDFVNMVVETNGARFASIVSTTDARVKKTSNDGTETNPNFKDTIKTSKALVILNHNYTNSVNNQRNREGDDTQFVAHPRTWGTRISGTSFVEHKDTLYLELKVESSLGYEYFNKTTGEHLDKDEVHSFITPRKESGRQQVANPVIIRDYKVSNLDYITMNGMTVRLTGVAPTSL
jgi:hypothetical protein